MKRFPIVAVTGGSCSGKSTFVKGFREAVIVTQDHFYKDISELLPGPDGHYNWDTPEAFDLEACRQAVLELAAGNDVEVPLYDYVSARRTGTQILSAPSPGQIVVVEGILALYPPLHDLAELRIYIEAPSEIRVARRIRRDLEKGRTPAQTLEWFIQVEEGLKNYIEPTRRYANLVVPFSHSPIFFSS